jgi:hypothetical protein
LPHRRHHEKSAEPIRSEQQWPKFEMIEQVYDIL